MRSDYLGQAKRRRPRGGADKAPRGLGWKVVMVTILVVLGVVVTIAVMKLVVGLATDGGDQAEADRFEQAVSDQLAAEQAAFEADADGDGLTDLLENIYRSDPAVADTDGDGTNDGQEVEEGRDPTVAGPNDVLNVKAAEDLLATESYSKQYVATLPADLSREDFLEQERIEAFIADVQSQTELVKPVPESEITITEASGAAAVETYLGEISPTTNESVATVTNEDIDAAFRSHYQQGQSEPIRQIIADLEGNVTILEGVSVPRPALELHQKLLGASRSLVENVKLLERMPQDLIGGLLGAKNIEDLGDVFAEIAAEIAALEAEFGLE